MNEIFVERNNNYSLRGNNVLTRRRVNSVRYGTETVSFLAPTIWDILPKDIKDSESLDIFKEKSKNGFHWNAVPLPLLSSKTLRLLLVSRKQLNIRKIFLEHLENYIVAH